MAMWQQDDEDLASIVGVLMLLDEQASLRHRGIFFSCAYESNSFWFWVGGSGAEAWFQILTKNLTLPTSVGAFWTAFDYFA